MSTPTIYERLESLHRECYENYKTSFETTLAQLSSFQHHFDELQKDMPALEKAGITFDLEYDYDPIHRSKNGAHIPRLVEISVRSLEHIVETMLALGWVVTEVGDDEGAVFSKGDASILIERLIPF